MDDIRMSVVAISMFVIPGLSDGRVCLRQPELQKLWGWKWYILCSSWSSQIQALLSAVISVTNQQVKMISYHYSKFSKGFYVCLCIYHLFVCWCWIHNMGMGLGSGWVLLWYNIMGLHTPLSSHVILIIEISLST